MPKKHSKTHQTFTKDTIKILALKGAKRLPSTPLVETEELGFRHLSLCAEMGGFRLLLMKVATKPALDR